MCWGQQPHSLRYWRSDSSHCGQIYFTTFLVTSNILITTIRFTIISSPESEEIHATNMFKTTICSMMTPANNLGLFRHWRNHQHYLHYGSTPRLMTFLETPSPLDKTHVKISWSILWCDNLPAHISITTYVKHTLYLNHYTVRANSY